LTTIFEVDGIEYRRPASATDRLHGNPMFKLKDDASRCHDVCKCGISMVTHSREQWTEDQIDTWVRTGRAPWW